MSEYINVHCHILNFKYVPGEFFKSRSPVREWLLKKKITAWIAHIVSFFRKGQMYDKLDQVLEILDKEIDGVAEVLLSEMREAGIATAVPLMMDLEAGCSFKKPDVPYRYQINFISEIAKRNPGTLIPFVMFDPQRPFCSDLVINALENLGFLGVKMYTPLGYHPDPHSIGNEENISKELEKMYDYCVKYSIPITTHCSIDSAYSDELIHCAEVKPFLCQPSSYEGVLKRYPKLRINFAHFGGNELKAFDPASWTFKIREFMYKYENVYADLAADFKSLEKKSSAESFKNIRLLMEEDIVKDRILFGTDWLLSRHTWTEKEYVEAFENGMGKTLFKKIAFDNPISFLFSQNKLPKNVEKFYFSNGIKKSDFPEWMTKNINLGKL